MTNNFMTNLDQQIDAWLNNLNYTIPHPNDSGRLDKLVLYGFRHIEGFSGAMLVAKIKKHNHNFNRADLNSLCKKIDTLLSFCKSNRL